MPNLEYRHEAEEYSNRKRRIIPINYCEAKRQKRQDNNVNLPEEPIRMKLEQIDYLRHSVGLLNARLGIETISDDEENMNEMDTCITHNNIIVHNGPIDANNVMATISSSPLSSDTVKVSNTNNTMVLDSIHIDQIDNCENPINPLTCRRKQLQLES